MHGSGLFTRGQTQALSVCTLAPLGEHQIIDGLGVQDSKRFIHHYNFPQFSVGSTGRAGSPGRREIGHGALGERALAQIIPSEEDFPYTIRLVAEVLESNGSSSQASICAGTLALMDAGVPIKAPVAGIAMGLVSDGENYTILTDIQGLEDHLGDMDFKVARNERRNHCFTNGHQNPRNYRTNFNGSIRPSEESTDGNSRRINNNDCRLVKN